jgi:hypothetical protein
VLTIWGATHRFCDRCHRRDFLRIGSLGLGLTLADDPVSGADHGADCLTREVRGVFSLEGVP